VLFALFACGLVALIGRLAFVQILDGARYASYATGEINQRVVLPAARGAVYDRSGNLLAASVPRFDVIADDFLVGAPGGEAARLAGPLGVKSSSLVPLLSEKNGYVMLAKQITSATEQRIAALDLLGISFQNDTLRVYPAGQLFQPLIGDVDAANNGDSAAEYAFNAALSGTPGSELVAEDPSGAELPAGTSDVQAPKQGTSIVLTIDEPLQVEATNDVERQMRATHSDSGIAIVMDVHTGAILAMVDLVTGPHGTIVPATQNLAVTSVYEPGSVMKLATISFALQDHLITPNSTFTVPYSINVGGYTFSDADFHDTEVLPVTQILAQSSNVGTIEISRLLGLDRLGAALKALGFGQPSGLNWPAESDGIVGTPSQWYGSAAASIPIGTGEAVTPMQVLDAYNSVANGGILVPPHLLQATIEDGVEHSVATKPGHRDLQASTVAELVPMLEDVTELADGTATEAKISGYSVAGKTGTAPQPETNGRGYVPGDFNATFVGFVPAQAPQLSGIVVLNHPTPIYGGTVAAPVFAQIMGYALSHFDVAPPSTTAAARTPAG
jgi:cell division protein FtsI (penicillin-binding protein 3)